MIFISFRIIHINYICLILRYDKIEVKCIFKTDKFNSIWDHHPKQESGHIHS